MKPFHKLLRGFGIALPLLFISLFLIFPLATIIVRGFRISAIRATLADSEMQQVIWFTLWQAVLSTILTIALSLPK